MTNFRRPYRRALHEVRVTLKNVRLLLVIVSALVAAFVAPLVVDTWLASMGVAMSSFLKGFSIGFALAVLAACIAYLVLVIAGANNFIVGGIAETWTKDVLKKLGGEWRIFDNIPFRDVYAGHPYLVDIDHVAVGPYGVVIFETKYSSNQIDLRRASFDQWVVQACSQASRNAQRLKSVLGSLTKDVPVIAVVVYWGPKVRALPDVVTRVGDTRVVDGARADDWIPRLQSGRGTSSSQIASVATRIEEYLASEAPKELALD